LTALTEIGLSICFIKEQGKTTSARRQLDPDPPVEHMMQRVQLISHPEPQRKYLP
jgi:hypothetical protein